MLHSRSLAGIVCPACNHKEIHVFAQTFTQTCFRTCLALCLAAACPQSLHAQAKNTASRTGDLQIGGSFNLAQPDYTDLTFKGFGAYATFDFRYHWGIDAEFHQVDDPNQTQGIYERTYEIGPRYVLHYGRFSPYAKAMYGRGVFNFPPAASDPTGGPAANLAFNIFIGGIGTDYRLNRSINLRADYEFQDWHNFPPTGLTPRVLTLGVAYHFH